MAVMDVLEQAQGGQLFRKLGEHAGVAPSDARRALDALCPAIAARLKERAQDQQEFERLVDLLEDNEGDLLAGSDPVSSEVVDDGRAVLEDLYGSAEAARTAAAEVAQALRIDENAMLKLHPISASLVLAALGTRYHQGEEEESDTTHEVQPKSGAWQGAAGGIVKMFLAAAGAAIGRALVNRLMPRRRRRTNYGFGYQGRSGRRKRELSVNDLFRGLLP